MKRTVLKKHELKEPIERRAKETGEVVSSIKEVEFIQPHGKQFKAMGKGETAEDKVALLVGACCDLTQAEFDELHWEDIAALGVIAKPFFDKYLEILKTSEET